MSLYHISVRTPAAAAGAAYAVVRTAASRQIRVREIGLMLSAATATPIGLIRAAGTGTPSTSVLGQARDTNDVASVTNLDSAWSVAPTIGSNYLRRLTLPATAGGGLQWYWMDGEGLVVPVSAGLVLWNFGGSAGAAVDLYLVWDE